MKPHVHQFLDFATTSIGLNVSIEQVRVAENSSWVSRSLKDLQIRREVGVIVLAIRRSDGQMVFNPDAEAVVNGGDNLIAMGASDQLKKLERILEGSR